MDLNAEDDNDFTQQNKSFRLSEVNLPKGHVLINLRWKNSELANKLESKLTLLYDDELNDVDFHPMTGVGVIYISEAEMVSQSNSYKRKMVRQRKRNTFKIIVIAEKTAMSSQYYFGIQTFCVLQLGLVLLPVANQVDAAGVLLQLAFAGTRPERNPFKRLKQEPPKKGDADLQKAMLATLQSIPGLGSMSAKLLILNFGSLLEIANASPETLSQLVGKSTALRMHNFLNS